MIRAFKLTFDVDVFALFSLATVLATFFQKLGKLGKNDSQL
jgi:hypothetical protein